MAEADKGEGMTLQRIRAACRGCSPDDVAEAIRMLRTSGILTLESTGCYRLRKGPA